MYDAAKNDKMQSANHEANKSIILGSILVIISIILFLTHWKWLKKIAHSSPQQ